MFKDRSLNMVWILGRLKKSLESYSCKSLVWKTISIPRRPREHLLRARHYAPVFRAAVHQAGPKALQLTVTQKAWKECNFLVSISYVKPPTASCCSEEVFGAMKVKHNENQTQLPISASIPRFLRASREGPLPRAFRPPTLSLSAFKGLLKQHFLQEGFLLLLYGPQS
ncbi:uncharacterized protein [Desmodus rotundus]|uniref:uncharacterized protein isoform X3 n=1 Tax=Desmodus rotundus TaxID=9430 RepID=UPI0023818937|nr:uncharacterized protein LOC123478353 isoform X4 [Desmodus rotundus]